MRASVVDMVNIMPNATGILMRNGLHTYPWVMHEKFNKIVEEWIQDHKRNMASREAEDRLSYRTISRDRGRK